MHSNLEKKKSRSIDREEEMVLSGGLDRGEKKQREEVGNERMAGRPKC